MGIHKNPGVRSYGVEGRGEGKGREKQSGHQCQAALEARFSGNNSLSGLAP